MTNTWNAAGYNDPSAATPMRPHMSLGQSLRAFFQNYARFNGRASRSEFWWVQLGVMLIGLAFAIAIAIVEPDHGSNGLSNTLQAIYSIWGLAIVIPNLAVEVRRLHDTNRSGWWLLLYLIPVIGVIALIVMWCGASRPEGARFDGSTQPKLGD